MSFIEPIAKLISALTKLPGVGPKTAQRYAYSIINMGQEEALALVEAIREARGKVRYCSKCGNFTDADPCVICRTRDKTIICVVKEPKDVGAREGEKHKYAPRAALTSTWGSTPTTSG